MKDEFKAAAEPAVPAEETHVTEHTMKLNGEDVHYKATAGTMMLKNDKGESTALVSYTAYTRTDGPDAGKRPVSFIYNGGPGSASAWLHMGAFGPKRVKTTDAAPTPPPPYDVVENPNTLLDKTDMVFIDPVGTGFSRVVGKGETKDFWGVDQDIDSLTQFVSKYVSQNDRWNSPKFLIGESYGTFRSAALVNSLQSRENMAFNGVVLISSVLDFATLSFPRGADLSYELYLPSYAATAAYHGMIKDKPADLDSFIAQAKEFAIGEYAAALLKGSKLGEAEKAAVAQKMSHFTGLSEDYLLKSNLRVPLPQFMAELQRSRGLVTGRLDSRFSGPAGDVLQSYAAGDPQSDAVSGAFMAAINGYLRKELEYNPDQRYELLNYKANGAWDWKHAGGNDWPGAPNVEEDLVQAMLANPNLQIEVENGIYDLATPFFATEHTINHLGLPPGYEDHIRQNNYEAGHMMYLREPDLAKLKANVAAFIDRASGGGPAPTPGGSSPAPLPS
ncbi:MAG TPA: peptidase S10 [Patescibacteria group bacterium]|nr:peptidase S10 [Patescibacteria group bacterium]